MPRADLSDVDLGPEDAPHMIDDVNFLLEMEIRPLRACIIKKDYEVLKKIWKRLPAWDSCHLYKLIELFIKRKDDKGLAKLTSPRDHFVTHFYEPTVLQ